MYSPTMLAVMYAGLAGTLLALLIATAQQKWQCKVFFLLALRLAIGWHFMFEGLHKLHSHMVGPTDTNRVFTSEPYMRVAPGPMGAYMRRQFNDPIAEIDARVKAPKQIAPADFAKMTADEQAAACPSAVTQQLDAMEDRAAEAVKKQSEKDGQAATVAEEKALKDVAAEEQKALAAAKTDDEKSKVRTKAEADRAKAKATAGKLREDAATRAAGFKEAGKSLLTAAKASYARWVYGVDARPTKVKFVTGDVLLTAPQRLEHLDWLRQEAKAAETRQQYGLGNGYGTDSKRLAELRTDLLNAETDLAKEASSFIAELKKDLNGGTAVDEPAELTRGQTLDKITMWFLIVVGACLMAGLFTRLACVAGAGFLVMTYLLHPAFPWYPAPPNTEGNPVFINKNVIECLALLALACMPTGRWLGLDALIHRCVFGRPEESKTA